MSCEIPGYLSDIHRKNLGTPMAATVYEWLKMECGGEAAMRPMCSSGGVRVAKRATGRKMVVREARKGAVGGRARDSRGCWFSTLGSSKRWCLDRRRNGYTGGDCQASGALMDRHRVGPNATFGSASCCDCALHLQQPKHSTSHSTFNTNSSLLWTRL
jgi:hypothetical protein